MKTKNIIRKTLILAVLGGAATFGSLGHAQSAAFTYQGKLDDGGHPATGIYELTFALHSEPEYGTAMASLPPMPTPVTNGLFTVMLDFDTAHFNGAARWLQVYVRTNGATQSAVSLQPRTSLGSAPHATYATKAGSVASGSAVKSLNNLKDDVTLTAGDNVTLSTSGNTITVTSSGGAFLLNGTAAYYDQGKVGIGTPNPIASLDVVGDWDGEQGALNLGGTKPTLRFTGNAVSGNQSWLMHLGENGGGNLEFYRRTGPGAWALTMALQPSSDVAFSTTTKLHFGNQVRQMLNLWSDEYALGVQAGTLYQRSSGAFAWHKFGRHSDAYADPGAGGRTLMTLDDNFLMVRGSGGEKAYIGGDGNGDVQVGSLNPGATLVALYNAADNTFMNLVAKDVAIIGSQNKLDVADNFAAYVRAADLYLGHSSRRGTPGRALVDLGSELHVNYAGDWGKTVIGGCVTSVRSLEITGGCDLAEPFPMSEKDLPEGSVVVIDETNPGSLRQATHAYDTRVAGIISGANGVNPGISLKQEGVLDQGQKVALTGRVYVKVDASFGAIRPGDLLTTSDTPGHAMKVSDSSRAQGAIIGKAMSTLDRGTGLVLALVSLQ